MNMSKVLTSSLITCSIFSFNAYGTNKEDIISRSNTDKVTISSLEEISLSKSGEVNYIQGNIQLGIPLINAAKADLAVSRSLRKILNSSERESFKIIKDSKTKQGNRILRYEQYIAGIRVIGGDVVLKLNESSNKVKSITNYSVNDIKLGTVPKIKKGDLNNSSTEPELVFLNQEGELQLAWKITEVKTARQDDCEIPFITYTNAMNGTPILSYPQRRHGLSRSISTYHIPANDDPCDPFVPPVITLVANESSGPPSQTHALNAWNHLESTYDYFHDVHGLDSWDGQGGEMKVYLRTGAPYNNAYWQGNTVHLGNGNGGTYGNFANSLDIIAHEFGHGVSDTGPRLIYSGESGAIEESFADIFGAGAQFKAEGPTSRVWMIGENVYKPNDLDQAFRYMSNPTMDNYSVDFYPDFLVTANDSGGVHANSGIGNLAFYLLSEGGTHPQGKTNIAVTGIGQGSADDIFYEAFLTLSPSADYEELQLETVKAAKNQFGNDSLQHVSVCDAWHAVGVNNTSADCTSPPPILAGPPASVSATSLQCFGQNNLSWSAVSGATSYEIYRSNYPSFTSGSYYASTTNTNRMVVVSKYTSQIYFKVKACNEGGCSVLSSDYGRGTFTNSCR
jgi:Zn-dependent metalloprotease